MISHNGRNIDFQDLGDGPAILFVPGSFSTPAACRPIQKLLPPGYRFVSTSLCGYGATDETRTADDFDIAHEIRVIEAVARHIGEPVHLVGHSFGGTVALAAALAGNIELRSIATFEANPLCLMLDRGRDDLFDAARQMSAAYEVAVQTGEVHAPRRIIDFWGGDGAWATMPEAVQEYCCDTAAANVLDWHTDFGFSPGLDDFAGLDIPVLLVRGALTNAAIVEMTEGLADCIPHARSVQIDGASHFLITTHPARCAGRLADFLETAGP